MIDTLQKDLTKLNQEVLKNDTQSNKTKVIKELFVIFADKYETLLDEAKKI